MITRNGICYDLTVSEYRATVKSLTYVFSSQLHLDKFMERIDENREKINKSLSKRFNVLVDVSVLADMILYKKIETRGFLIVTNEGQELWQNEVTFVGDKVTMTCSNGQ